MKCLMQAWDNHEAELGGGLVASAVPRKHITPVSGCCGDEKITHFLKPLNLNI